MKFSIQSSLCFTALFCTSQSNAFDLWDAWQAARNHSAQYAAAAHERNATLENEQQAKAQLLPQLSASASYSDQPQSGYDQYETRGWNVQLSQPLFDKSKWSQYQAEKIGSQAADTTFDNTDADLLLDVAKAYLNILTIKDKLTAIDSEKAAYLLQIEQAQALFDAGEATIIDTYEAQSGYDAAIAKEVDLNTQLISAQNTLENATGLPSQTIDQITIPTLPDWLETRSEQDWLTLASEHNPILQTRQLILEKAQADLTAIEDLRLPTVNLNLGYQDMRNDIRYSSGLGMSNRGVGTYVGVQFTVPLYTGGSTASRIQQGEEQAKQQAALLEEARRTIRLNVRQAYASLRGKQAQIHAQQQLLTTNKAKLESTRLGREVGVRSNLDEIKAQQDKATAEEQLAEARYGAIEAYLQLLHAAGRLNQDEGKDAVLALSQRSPLTNHPQSIDDITITPAASATQTTVPIDASQYTLRYTVDLDLNLIPVLEKNAKN